MRGSTIASLSLMAAVSAAVDLRRAVCNADNCARLITGTQAGLPSTRLQDCSSYQQITVTGPVITSTITVTPTITEIATPVVTETTTPTLTETLTSTNTVVQVTTVTSDGSTTVTRPAKRDVSVKTIPAYAASSCPGTRYASACSCAGIKPTTVTVPGSTASVTVTGATVTSTVTGSPNTSTATAATVTSDVFTTTETTIQSTTTVAGAQATATGYKCGSTVQGNGIYSFRRYTVYCGQRVIGGNVAYTSIVPDESTCLKNCNSIKYCVYAEYQLFGGTCNLFFIPPSSIVDDAGYDALILQ